MNLDLLELLFCDQMEADGVKILTFLVILHQSVACGVHTVESW
jgi:hypothetical protein